MAASKELNRSELIALIERSLGLRHKLKVHESLEAAETHEDIAVMLFAKWELEDELQAIEEILAGVRKDRVCDRKELIRKDILKLVAKQQAKKKLVRKKPNAQAKA